MPLVTNTNPPSNPKTLYRDLCSLLGHGDQARHPGAYSHPPYRHALKPCRPRREICKAVLGSRPGSVSHSAKRAGTNLCQVAPLYEDRALSPHGSARDEMACACTETGV